MGNGKRKMGNVKWEMGNVKWEMGNVETHGRASLHGRGFYNNYKNENNK